MIGRLNHVAIVVPDLAAAAARYRDLLGADVQPPRDLPEHGVTVVFVTLENSKIELMAPLGEASPIAKFLAEADAFDPPVLAAQLAPGTAVLLTCSDKDTNVSCAQVEPLRAALAHTDLQYELFATANHGLEELGPLPPGPADLVALLPVSGEFVAAMDGWAAARGR